MFKKIWHIFGGSLIVMALVFFAAYLSRIDRDEGYISEAPAAATAQARILSGQKIDINKASAEEFDLLPGIGRGVAEGIVGYRDRNGPFRSIQDMDNVKGVGPSTIEKIAPFVK